MTWYGWIRGGWLIIHYDKRISTSNVEFYGEKWWARACRQHDARYFSLILITIIIIMTVVISNSLIKDGSGQGVPTYVVETRSLPSCLTFSFN